MLEEGAGTECPEPWPMPGPSTGSGRPRPGKLHCLFGGFPGRDPPTQLPAGPSKIKKILQTRLLNKQTNDSLNHRDPEPAHPWPAVKGQDGHRGPPEHSLKRPVPLGTGQVLHELPACPHRCPSCGSFPDHWLLTSGISRGTRRTCIPCRTTGLGCSRFRPPAASGTSAEWKLEECEWRSLWERQP